jgi:hypothetical protein
VLGGRTFIARSVADGIARKLGNALVAPVLLFSPTDNFVKSPWPGTISVSTELYTRMNEAIVTSMVVAGFRGVGKEMSDGLDIGALTLSLRTRSSRLLDGFESLLQLRLGLKTGNKGVAPIAQCDTPVDD